MRYLRSLLFAIAAICTLLTAPSLRAADDTFVGILALASDDGVAKQLGLSDDTRAALDRLIKQREDDALELSQQTKDLPPDDRAAKLAAFRQESEQLGLKLFNDDQIKHLQQLRLAHDGLASLADPNVAKQLQLNTDQQAKIADIMKERSRSLARATPQQRKGQVDYYERALGDVITPEQRTKWDLIVGGAGYAVAKTADNSVKADDASAKTAGAAPSADTKSESSVKTSAAPSSPAASSSPASANSIAGGASNSGNTTKTAGKTAVTSSGLKRTENGKILFNFRYAPWKDVLELFAEKADLSLVMDLQPQGTFNYQDDRAYTTGEAIDVLNSVLLTRDFTLVRRDRMLMVVSLKDGIPPNLIPSITLDELPDRGKYELVCATVPINRLSVDEATQIIKPLLSAQGGWVGTIVPLPQAHELLVTDTGGKLRTIKQILDRSENPDFTNTDGLRHFETHYASPTDVLTIAKQLLNISSDQSANAAGTLRIMLEPGGKRILASGRPEMIDRFAEIVKMLDVPGKGAEAYADEQLQFEVYPLTTADPKLAMAVMQTLLAGHPDVRLSQAPDSGALLVLARPSEHATIRATLNQMQNEGQKIDVIQLRELDPEKAVVAINKLFAGGDEKLSVNAPKVEAETTLRRLLVRGTEAQVSQIKAVVAKMEGPDSDIGGATERGNIRMIPLTGRQGRAALEQLQQLWPATHQNSIHIITPSGGYPEIRPGSGNNGTGISPGGIIDERRPSQTPPAGSEMPSSSSSSQTPSTRAAASQSNNSPALPRTMVPANANQQNQTGQRELNKADQSRPNAVLPERTTRTTNFSHFQLVDFRDDARQEDHAEATPSIAAAPSTASTSSNVAKTDANNSNDKSTVAKDESSKDQNNTAGSDQGSSLKLKDSDKASVPGAPIVIVVGASGVMIASEDKDALNDFEKLLSALVSKQFQGQREYTVFYLKHTHASVAAELLGQIFGGGTISGGNSGGSIAGDFAERAFGGFGGGLIGGFLGGNSGGDNTAPAGMVSGARGTGGPVDIVPDVRLNALIVQASPADVDTIEQLLHVLDQPDSPEDVALVTRPRLIKVYNTSVDTVADVIKQVYAERLTGAAGQQRQLSPQDFITAIRGGRGGRNQGGNQQQEDLPKMSIGVDERNQTLIVDAPDPLFNEVQDLVQKLDQASPEDQVTTRLVTLKATNPQSMQSMLLSVLGDQAHSNTASATPNGSSSTSRTASNQNSNQPGGFGQGGGNGFGGFRPQGGGGFPGGFGGGFGGPGGFGGGLGGLGGFGGGQGGFGRGGGGFGNGGGGGGFGRGGGGNGGGGGFGRGGNGGGGGNRGGGGAN